MQKLGEGTKKRKNILDFDEREEEEEVDDIDEVLSMRPEKLDIK